jgi:hypothetical protein
MNAGLDFYYALTSHYQSQKQEALAILKLYFQNPVAVGDHPTHLQDMKEWVKKLAEAEEALGVMDKHFILQVPDQPQENSD